MKPRNKKILITGGAGFIGSHLCRRLIDSYALDIIDIDLEKVSDLRDNPGASFHELDIRDAASDDVTRELIEDADLVIDLYNMCPQRNYQEESTGKRTGKNVLHLDRSLAEEAERRDMDEDGLRERLDTARVALVAADLGAPKVRERVLERVRPLGQAQDLAEGCIMPDAVLDRSAHRIGVH